MSHRALVTFGDFQLDMTAPMLMRGPRPVDLAPKEIQILILLVRNAGRIVLKQDLLNFLRSL